MATRTRFRGRRPRKRLTVHKPRGVLHPRVQQVGPEHFGVVCVDAAKARSKWMLCDFYGKLLVEPTDVVHSRGGFNAALALLREALEQHRLRDLIVAIERTGNYHLPVRRAFAAAGYETRIVHPFATKQFRQPANPGNKTDETDLAAIFRATTNGFGLVELPWDDLSQQAQLLARHRRDLVEKRSALCCQIREHLEAVLPGYAALFDDLWGSSAALALARQFGSAEALEKAGVEALRRAVGATGHPCRRATLERVLAWTRGASLRAPLAPMHQRVWLALDEDRLAKTGQIQALERDLAALLTRTPYVLLMSHPGVNVVSAAELAGEMGPIEYYANAKAITGRAGLYPSRYQSDEVDLANGRLIRCANRRLRAVLMMIADNLIQCNHHFRALRDVWTSQGKDPRHAHVKVACRFARIAYQIVAGRQVFRHPSIRGRDYILDKLLVFHRQHETPANQMLADLQAATRQVPKGEHRREAIPLQIQLENALARRRGPRLLADVLPLVLARLGVGPLQSTPLEDQNPS